MNLARVFSPRMTIENVAAVDSSGVIEGVFRQEKDGLFVKREQHNTEQKPFPCWLAIPPGSCVVRSLQLSEISQKNLVQAVTCFAESSLLQPYENGYVAVRTVKRDSDSLAVLFWCEKVFLDTCVASVEQANFTVQGILVPELLLGHTESCLLYYKDTDASHTMELVCQASPLSPPIIQCGVPGTLNRDALLGAVQQEAHRLNTPKPKKMFIWHKRVQSDSPLPALPSVGGQEGVTHINVQSWADVLPFWVPTKETRSQLPFKECLHRENLQALNSSGYYKVISFAAVALVSLVAFVSTLYAQLEYEVSRLEKESARVTRESQKANKATQLIRNLQEKNKTIRNFAQDKPYSLELLKIIADATSTESRLESVSITRDGNIVINGLSKDASHVTTIVKKLEESSRVVKCKLTSLEHVAEKNEYKFTIQARSENWATFFEKSST